MPALITNHALEARHTENPPSSTGGTISVGRRRRCARRFDRCVAAARRSSFKPQRLTPEAIPGSRRRSALAGGSSLTPIAPPRVFLYTRYSTEPQEKERSEERQIRDLRAYGLKQGFGPPRIFSDRALSGTSMVHRAGLQALLAAARLKLCDVVVVEDLDRLSRFLPDLFAIFYELQSLGIALHDLRNGKLELIHIVMRGYMSEEGRLRFLALARSGKRRAVEDGFNMARVALGFRPHDEEDGILVADPANAELVVWIFEQIAAGVSATSVARLLTARKVPPPEQAYQILRGKPPVEIKAWHGNSVLKIVRNHLYLGIVSWGTKKAVYDFGRRKVKGYETTDEAEWIVYRYDHMRIVCDDLFARANMRLGVDGFGGRKHLGRFLLTDKVRCGDCGAPLSATGSSGGTVRYQCTRHVREGDAGCDAAVQYRIDWLERAVITAIATKIFTDAGRSRLVHRFEGAVEALLAEDERRRREIGKRLGELACMLKASVERTRGEASPLEDVVRKGWEDEAVDLHKEAEGLREPQAFLAPLRSFDSLAGRFDEMLCELPFRPQDGAGLALKQAFRDPIAEVRVFPPDDEGWVKVIVVIDLLAGVRGSGEIGPLPVDLALGRTCLEIGYNVDEMRKTERDDHAWETAEAKRLAEVAASGVCDLSDACWARVVEFFDGIDCVVEGERLDARLVVDGMVCLCFAGGPITRLPERFQANGRFERMARRIVFWGAWDKVVGDLRETRPEMMAGARPDRFETTDWPRRMSGALPPGADAARRDRAELLALAALEPEGDPVRLRLEVVADILTPLGILDAARMRKLTASQVYHYWDNYKNRGGIAALTRKVYKKAKETMITSDQIAMLGDIARTGVHPLDDRILTYPIMTELCETLFGVSYSRGGMRILCTRGRFPLRPHTEEARRRIYALTSPSTVAPTSTWSRAGRAMSLRVREGSISGETAARA